MPYKSLEQERYFHWAQSQGKMPKSTVDEFDEASKGLKLPKYSGEDTGEEEDKFPRLTKYLNPKT